MYSYHVLLQKTKLLRLTERSLPNTVLIDWISLNDKEKATHEVKELLLIRGNSIYHYYRVLRFLEPLSVKKKGNDSFNTRPRIYNKNKLWSVNYAIP